MSIAYTQPIGLQNIGHRTDWTNCNPFVCLHGALISCWIQNQCWIGGCDWSCTVWCRSMRSAHWSACVWATSTRCRLICGKLFVYQFCFLTNIAVADINVSVLKWAVYNAISRSVWQYTKCACRAQVVIRTRWQ